MSNNNSNTNQQMPYANMTDFFNSFDPSRSHQDGAGADRTGQHQTGGEHNANANSSNPWTGGPGGWGGVPSTFWDFAQSFDPTNNGSHRAGAGVDHIGSDNGPAPGAGFPFGTGPNFWGGRGGWGGPGFGGARAPRPGPPGSHGRGGHRHHHTHENSSGEETAEGEQTGEEDSGHARRHGRHGGRRHRRRGTNSGDEKDEVRDKAADDEASDTVRDSPDGQVTPDESQAASSPPPLRPHGRHGRHDRGPHSFRAGSHHYHGPHADGPPHAHAHGPGPQRRRGGGRGRGGALGGLREVRRSGGPWDFKPMIEAMAAHPFAQQFRSYVRGSSLSGQPKSGDQRDTFTPPIDVFSTERAYVIHVSLPGAIKEDIGLNFDPEKSVLHITGVVHRPGKEEFLQSLTSSERKVGMFERTIKLPPTGSDDRECVDGFSISAKMENGVLIISVPKVEKEWTEIHRIDVD